MLNRVTLHGRLGKDVELRRTSNGTAVASWSIAVDRDYKADGAERETDWFDITAWRGTAEFAERNFHRGDQMIVSGRLQVRSWTDRDGNKRKSVEVLADGIWFCGGKNTDGGNGSAAKAAAGTKPVNVQAQAFDELEDDDGDLPF